MCGYPYQIITSFSFWCTLPRGRDGLQSELVQGIVLVLAVCYCSVAQSCPTLLRPHRLQHARLLCPSLSPEVCSDSCPPSWWCSLPSCPLLPPSPFAFNLSQHQGLFQWFAVCIRWPKYWSFNFSISSLEGTDIQGWFPLVLTGLISSKLKR